MVFARPPCSLACLVCLACFYVRATCLTADAVRTYRYDISCTTELEGRQCSRRKRCIPYAGPHSSTDSTLPTYTHNLILQSSSVQERVPSFITLLHLPHTGHQATAGLLVGTHGSTESAVFNSHDRVSMIALAASTEALQELPLLHQSSVQFGL